MTGIFVSYRRDDSQGFAGRLTDDLSDMLGSDSVFRDIEIPFGSDFTDILHRAIAASDILLVVIGRHWAADSDQGYESRLFEPADWVRIEIEAALAQGKQVVPVRVGGAGKFANLLNGPFAVINHCQNLAPVMKFSFNIFDKLLKERFLFHVFIVLPGKLVGNAGHFGGYNL